MALVMLLSMPRWLDVRHLVLFPWFVALLLWLCLSSFWSEPFVLREAISVWVRALLVFCFVVALGECQLRGEVQRWLALGLMSVGLVTVAASLINFYLTDPIDGRLNGLGQLDTHVIAALIFAVVAIFVLQFALQSPTKARRFVATLALLVVLFAIALSDSRNAWVATSIGLVTMLLSHFIKQLRLFLVCYALLVTFAAGLLWIVLINASASELILPRGLSFRPEIWAATLSNIAQDSYIFGSGILSSEQVAWRHLIFDHPHNMYLSVFRQGGVIALFLFLIVLGLSLRQALRCYEHPDAKLALSILALSLSAYLLDGHELIDKVGEVWFLIWLPVGLCLGLNWRVVPNREL